jgi:predicted kinase
MLIAMAGLPGTGKSTLARALAEDLRRDGIEAIVLDKDETRAALFPPPTIEYSAEQDDLCIEIMLQVAAFLLRRDSQRVIVLDGRTFTRRSQVMHVTAAAERLVTPLIFIECRCDDATALRRLTEDHAQGRHLAANRSAALYLELKAGAEPLTMPHLLIDMEKPLADALAQCRAYLNEKGCTTGEGRAA